MDTKSKKSKPFLVWLCFFLGINIVLLVGIVGIFAIKSMNDSQYDFGNIKASFLNDFKNSGEFKHFISSRFDELTSIITGKIDSDSDAKMIIRNLEDESSNLIYLAENIKTGKIITNAQNNVLQISDYGVPEIPKGYNYYLYFNGAKFSAEKDGRNLDIYRNDAGYKNGILGKYLTNNLLNDMPEIADTRVLLIIKKDIKENPYSSSWLYTTYKEIGYIKWIILVYVFVFLIGICLLVFSIIKRKTKHEYNETLARISSWFWLEVKVIATILLLSINISISDRYIGFSDALLRVVFIIVSFWWFYFIMNDIWINRRAFFTHNIINSIIKKYKDYESGKPFQKAMLARLYILICVETILIFFAVVFTLSGISSGNGGEAVLVLAIIALGIYLIYRYVRKYNETVTDIGKIIDQIEAIKNGDMSPRHLIKTDTDLFTTEDNLNKIQEGLVKIIDEKTRSERMKVELVTNVSHDLKTPLTSIISYVDLLTREEGLPAHVEDYIKILSQKSERLKTLIQDLFDLSKATSGEMMIANEKLDLGKLIRQTLGEMNEQVTQSGLEFKVNIHDEPILISSDGSKLYRVFQNLFANALKYSLKGSRVYVDLTTEGSRAVIVIKNTSSYEMNFNEEDILERFVRGDVARSTEGSGLGLAIAQNFTQICGGHFQIKVDGDLFKVIMSFDIY